MTQCRWLLQGKRPQASIHRLWLSVAAKSAYNIGRVRTQRAVQMKNPPLVSWTTVAQQFVRWRLKLLVLNQALVGGQSPQPLLKSNLLVAFIVFKAFPLFFQARGHNSGPCGFHLGQGAGKGALHLTVVVDMAGKTLFGKDCVSVRLMGEYTASGAAFRRLRISRPQCCSSLRSAIRAEATRAAKAAL
jgi:hypothetical protein